MQLGEYFADVAAIKAAVKETNSLVDEVDNLLKNVIQSIKDLNAMMEGKLAEAFTEVCNFFVRVFQALINAFITFCEEVNNALDAFRNEDAKAGEEAKKAVQNT